LQPAADELAKSGILLRFTDLKVLEPIEKQVCAQEAGSHADETETSMLLYIDPGCVDMSKAVKDCSAQGKGGLSRDANSGKTYSPSGIWGDPTLATRAKGETICEAFVKILLAEIEATRSAEPPAATTTAR